MKNKIDDLRNHLFLALERVGDAKPEELEREIARARAVSEVGHVIVDAAKAEIEFIKATGASRGSGFIPETVAGERTPVLPPKGTQRRLGRGSER